MFPGIPIPVKMGMTKPYKMYLMVRATSKSGSLGPLDGNCVGPKICET